MHAAFECKVSIVDEARRESISQELYRRRKADVGDATAHMGTGDSDDEDLIGYESVEPGLPPASSDRQKWWLDNKQPARAAVPVPNPRNGQAVALNPNRPSNPFGQTDESDWISIPRSSSKASLSSISSSPFEKVNLPHNMVSTSSIPPRKLPPPYDPAGLPAKVGRMALTDDHSSGSRNETPPPPPPPRRQTGGMGIAASGNEFGLNRSRTQPLPAPIRPIPSSASYTKSPVSQSSKTGKSPPPVAKKPAHLATVSPMSSPAPSHSSLDDDLRPPLPTRVATAGLTTHGVTPSRKPVTQANSGTNGSNGKPSTPVRAVGLPGMTGGDMRGTLSGRKAPPAVHAKPQQQQQQHKRGPVDLLSSLDEHHEVGGWETLQPSTRA